VSPELWQKNRDRHEVRGKPVRKKTVYAESGGAVGMKTLSNSKHDPAVRQSRHALVLIFYRTD